jgi:phosphoglycerate dehydrogenase-like enzyme
MSRPQILLLEAMPDDVRKRLPAEFLDCDFLDGRDPAARDRLLARANVTYGLPPIERLAAAAALRWVQLISAGVPPALCNVAQARQLTVTNLAGLYGPSIAEHGFAMMTVLARNLHLVLRNQLSQTWDRSVIRGMADLHEKTLAVLGLGNIGQGIARLGKAYGMRVLGFRRRPRPAYGVDRLYERSELRAMLGEADVIGVALPLTRHTEGLLGPAEFAAVKRGAIYVNISRGPVAQEAALVDALRTGQVGAAGLDVFAVEPLPPGHPFWTMPQVIVSPHYSGEVVNTSALPAERFARNLRAAQSGGEMEGVVDLEWGY